MITGKLTSQRNRARLLRRLGRIRHVALDLDGTIYSGGSLFECTPPFLAALGRIGIGHSFLTNNPSKSLPDYLAHLRRFGLSAEPDQIYTSAHATIDHLRFHLPGVRRLFILGTESMTQEFTAAGFQATGDSPADEPDAVICSFDLGLTYSRLCRAAWWIRRGKLFIATNPDLVCPTDQPTVLVDCGAICAALERAGGRAPDFVFGKPDPAMLRGIQERHALAPEAIAMVGDRIYTDILMARRAGAFAVLVLTGETTAEAAITARRRADLTVPSLAEFGNLLLEAHARGSGPARRAGSGSRPLLLSDQS